MTEERFLLKDHLYNKTKVQKIAQEIFLVFPGFEQKKFEWVVLKKFPELDLMERMHWIRDCLRTFLPEDYRQAVVILMKALPAPNNPTLTDDDFGDFIYAPYGSFVAEYGATKKDVIFSLKALRVMTSRFSCEFPIRTFINQFPAETMVALRAWTTDSHYQVRRLVSEGTRPTLPWGKNIALDYRTPIRYLDSLYADNTRYVTRSVANHLNDIAKKDPELVIATLQRWKEQQLQSTAELAYIMRHSLRTLVKNGNTAALALLGYTVADVLITKPKLVTTNVKIGDALEWSFSITSQSKKAQSLMIDYIIYFQKASGDLSPKTFKISKVELQPEETLDIVKGHPLRLMTTKKLHAGQHQVELQINGIKFGKTDFYLVE